MITTIQSTFIKWNSIYHILRHISNHCQEKDIHDFYGVHSDWLKLAAVALVVHHHHEKITARDLLNHKRPANHSTDRHKIEKLLGTKNVAQLNIKWFKFLHGSQDSS